MSLQTVFFTLILSSLLQSSFGWFLNWTFHNYSSNSTSTFDPFDFLNISSAPRLDMCKGHDRIVATNGSNVHMLVGPGNYTVDYSYNRDGRCVRVSEECGITALKSNQTIAVFQGS
jgi:hypothetical protein